jgi:hypothetical protein
MVEGSGSRVFFEFRSAVDGYLEMNEQLGKLAQNPIQEGLCFVSHQKFTRLLLWPQIRAVKASINGQRRC